jgi:hypothetical protein
MFRRKATMGFWLLLVCLIGVLGIQRGSAYVTQTIADYDGVCGKLQGVPRLLQKVGLLGPEGTCLVDDIGGREVCHNPNGQCQTNGGKQGNCTQRAVKCHCQ